MFFETLHRLLLWAISFGVLAYALWRWGKAGFIGLPTRDVISEFFRMLLQMIRERPLLMAFLPIGALLLWYYYIMK